MADKSLNLAGDDLNDAIYDHRWGFKDSRLMALPNGSVTMTGSRYALSGTEMPELLPFAEEILHVKFDTKDIRPIRQDKPVPPAVANDGFTRELANSFPESQFTQDPRQRLIHSHGQTTADEVYKVLYTELERVADLVFFAESEEDVEQLIHLAAKHDVCLVPYGGGTSVSSALVLPADERRMIVMVAMMRMNKLLWVDKENSLACAEAGITGRELEAALAKHGVTIGHEPDSMELSTLGGWVATNASGMKKNKYGNIEDIVQNFTLITPRGVVEQTAAVARTAIGMQPHKLLFGNEGNLGIITKATFAVHPLPEKQKFGSIVFRDFKTGADFLYALTQTGVLPASIRLLDNIQFRFGSALKPKPSPKDKLMSQVQQRYVVDFKGFNPTELVAATVLMEGSKSEVAYQEKHILNLAKQFGGISGGETNGKRGYMLTYAIAYLRDFFAEFDVIGETYETTVPWSRIHDVCEAVDKRAREMHHELGLPGEPYVSPRITQLYRTGVCIYFTHGFSTKGFDNADEIFANIEREMRRTIMANGGSLSHHHGIGKLRADFMPDVLSDTSIELLRDIKQTHDPDNVFGIANNVMGVQQAVGDSVTLD